MVETLRSRPDRHRAAGGGVRAAAGRVPGRRARVGHLQRHRRAPPGRARVRDRARRRGRDQPVQLRRVRQLRALRGRAAGVLRHRPAHAQHRTRGRRGGGHRAHHRRCCPCTSSATRPTCPASSGWRPSAACGWSRTPARRSARCTRDGTMVGARGNPATFGFYPNKQLATGEGGALTSPDAAFKARVDSERNQGRAPDMGWLDHDRLGFNYRLSALACALGVAQLERLDADAGRPRPRRGALRRARWPGSRASSCRARTPAATAAAGSSTWSSCRPASTATTTIRALREQGHRLQALPAGDPPDELLPRALRPPRRASSRSARTWPRARWRCRSSRS